MKKGDMLWPRPLFFSYSSAFYHTVGLNIKIILDILHILVFIIVIIITTSIVIVGVDSGYYERMLLRDLMENYQKLERPVSCIFSVQSLVSKTVPMTINKVNFFAHKMVFFNESGQMLVLGTLFGQRSQGKMPVLWRCLHSYKSLSRYTWYNQI